MPKIIFTGLFQEKVSGLWLQKYCEQLASYLTTKGYIIDFFDLSPVQNKMTLPASCNHKYIGNSMFLPWNSPTIDKNNRQLIWTDSSVIDYIRTFIGMICAFNTFKAVSFNDDVSLIIHHNGTLSIQRLFKHVALTRGIPQLFLQASTLPETVEIDSVGTQALNWTVHNPYVFNKLLISDGDIKNAKDYIDLIKEKHKAIKLKKFDEVEKVRIKIERDKKPIIFFAGSGKYGNGIWPRFYPESFCRSPFYKDDYEALPELLKIAKENNYYILFKPHPEDPVHKLYSHPNLLIVKDLNRENILSYIFLSSVVTTLVSSVSVLALIYDKPTILLGRNMLIGKGLAYELNAKNELLALINISLKDGFTNYMKENLMQYIARALKYHVFSCGSNLDKFTGGVEKTGEFIIQHCVRNKL